MNSEMLDIRIINNFKIPFSCSFVDKILQYPMDKNLTDFFAIYAVFLKNYSVHNYSA